MQSLRNAQHACPTAPRRTAAQLHTPRSRTVVNVASPNMQPAQDKLYCSWEVYADMSALQAYPKLPALERGGAGIIRLKKAGFYVFDAAHVLPQPSDQEGPRRYDWRNKASIALKSEELVEIRDWTVNSPPLKFTHTSKAGDMTMFMLQASRPQGAFITVEVQSARLNNAVGVPMSVPQLKVLQALVSYAIPRLYAHDVVFDQGFLQLDGQAQAY